MNKNKGLAKSKLLRKIYIFLKSSFWFFVGFFLSALCLISLFLVYIEKSYKDKVITGVFIDNVYVGDKTRKEVEQIFENKNILIGQNTFTLYLNDSQTATVSAKDLRIGYNSKLIAEQAMGIGKTSNLPSDFYMIISAYLQGLFLDSSYTFSTDDLKTAVDPIQKQVFVEAEDALFTIRNNRVTAFRESRDGKVVDYEKLNDDVKKIIPIILKEKSVQNYKVKTIVKTIKPSVTTEEANDFGIVEMIGKGVSHFRGSIQNRIYNISLASSRVNGVIVGPGEIFSFNKSIGDISSYTGYKQAYIIKDGRTVLGDGGGVCQVSTTLFRAVLASGLPITERNAHSYRVGYYEQDSGPGIDATVYYPTEDFKFKNDTGKYILIQVAIDPVDQRLEFLIYGKGDGRGVVMTKPVISSQSPAPPPLYQDDPTLPKDTLKQIDFEAPGAVVSFKRTVSKNGKVIISETFTSRYSPWQSVFLKGTRE